MRGGTEVTKDGREKQEVKDPRCYLSNPKGSSLSCAGTGGGVPSLLSLRLGRVGTDPVPEGNES